MTFINKGNNTLILFIFSIYFSVLKLYGLIRDSRDYALGVFPILIEYFNLAEGYNVVNVLLSIDSNIYANSLNSVRLGSAASGDLSNKKMSKSAMNLS